MIYCPDCGATNEARDAGCRVCGRNLAIERGTAACPACAELTAEGAAFCSACGAPCAGADDVLLAETAAGRAFDLAPVGAVTGTAVATADDDPASIGAGLDLPDWLKRAAAETPAEPALAGAAPAEPFGVHGTNQLGGAGFVLDRGAAPAPLPDGGLGTGLPAWLRDPATAATASAPSGTHLTEPGATAQGASRPPIGPGGAEGPVRESGAAPLAAAGRPVAPAAPAADLTDTRSFISENDLPAWLRQLAAAEADAEAERAAQDLLARAEAEHAAAQARQAQTAEAERAAAARPAGQAKADPAATAPAGGWLARSGGTDAAPAAGGGSARRSTFAELVSTQPSRAAGTTDPAAEPTAAERPALTPVAPAAAGPARGGLRQRPLAAALLVAVLIALVVLGALTLL